MSGKSMDILVPENSEQIEKVFKMGYLSGQEKKGNKEINKPEKYYWVAQYNDGTELRQYEHRREGVFLKDVIIENRYGDIERHKLVAFELIGNPPIRLVLEPEQRLIYRRRVQMDLKMNQAVYYIVGWQQTIAGQNVQSMWMIHPNGAIEMISRWREDNVLYNAPVLIDAEKVS